MRLWRGFLAGTTLNTFPRRGRTGFVMTLLLAMSNVSCVERIDGVVKTPSTPSTPGGSPNPPSTPPDQVTGLAYWAAQCMGCHGTFLDGSALSTGDTNGNFRLDADSAVTRYGDRLAMFIDDEMPRSAPSACRGPCAEQTAAYVRSRRQPVVGLNCPPPSEPAYGVRELKLLTSLEYQRSLEDLLGVDSNLGTTVANNDATRGGFVNNRGRSVNSATLETYMANAESVATWAVAHGRPFDCRGGAACAARFVDEFLFRAFRGPVSAEQRALFTGLFETYPADGLRLALEAALSSPIFLYRVEAGVDLQTAIDRGYHAGAGVAADAFVLSPFEFASALSFMLTGSTPDGPLLEAAQAGRLTTPVEVRQQVERLIDSARGRQHMGDFVTQWFGLDDVKSASRPDVADFTPAVKEAMVQEVREHFAHVFYDENVPFSEFFGGNYTFLNRTLADFYGIPGNFGDAFVRTEVVGRGGPIASGAFMAANAHVERTAPILRAVHTRQAALCHYIDPPNSPIAGENIDQERAAAQMRVAARERQEGGLSSRDFYFLYTDGIAACAGCHERTINPMFGMEDFDHVGRLRPAAGVGTVTETVGGLDWPVSLEGTLFGVDSVSDPTTITYAGAKDLSNKIARTDAVKSCLIRRGFRYATGLAFLDRDLDVARREEISEEQRRMYGCAASRMTDALVDGGESPRAMFVELATESLVRLRR